MGLYSLVLKVRALLDIGYYMPEWLVYSLPNGLWAYSFMFFITFIWGDVKSLGKTFFIVLVVALSVGSELGQWLKLLPGTFCLTDVLLYSGGLLFGYYQGKIF